ncbi:alpha-L-arabinofuranosidase C-terminal domain-containing protein [Lachnoclostridium sp. An118]|uniref:alpha-L-arabinofuranosidase C-terminal domain-containing protein n=1 Tax=Lachnoclostridium sp. An118 TaxID=1965547 RepID=UPI000B388AE7|nr:alpha-L-arabinofuranosidase C-terminal domain-containing protein [Lachnoclostridium sp. An118]OUQ47962.1 alpha-N-arabinofuranosidase [Lachnoclostridium sp. An118]
MILHVNRKRRLGQRNPMIYGHFIEHFHRQIYGGIYDPGNPLSDEDGLRTDVLDAMRHIRVPVLRWPGGCFVSSYHWKDAVGEKRTPFFDKAWRVEDPNTFGTDEYVNMCRKLGCEPYICTNAGTGTAEEMSDWVEYCNLENEGQYARWRIANGYEKPHRVKYWSVGNENYGAWEIGAKSAQEWGRLVAEASKMIKHVDPETELTAAALTDLDWNINLLRMSGQFLDWISIHRYWDDVHEHNDLADYETVMAFTNHTGDSIRQVRGLLEAMGLEKKIKIAFDEWNLRGWCHPKAHTVSQGVTKEDYLYPRDLNDDNSKYTMADAVFSACFLNECNRNCDIVGMANFAPIVNTRGCIYTYKEGIVLRSTYHVFDLYVNYLGDVILDAWSEGMKSMEARNSASGQTETTELIDVLATEFSDREGAALAVVNKHPGEAQEVTLDLEAEGVAVLYYIAGSSTESYNDVDREEVRIQREDLGVYTPGMKVSVKPHSVGVIQIGVK